MKKYLLFTLILVLSLSIMAQAPQLFNYQAVIRNADGEVVQNKNISLMIEIISSDDEIVYAETHALMTNDFGLINTPIGTGESSLTFSDIDWSKDQYKVRVSFDAEGGNNFTEMGESQLLSVPYALHALSGGTKQELSINGNTITLSEGGSITLPEVQVDDADADPTNEIQTLSINGDTIYLSDGGSITLPKSSSFSGNFDDLSNLPANLDTDVTDDFSGNYADLVGTPNWSDSIKNNITDLSGYDANAADDFDGNYNSLSNLPSWSDSIAAISGGTSFSGNYSDLANLPSWNDSITASLPDLSGYDADASDDFTGMYNDLINLPVWNDSIDKYIATVDASNSNEIQDLELVGSTLRITNNTDATDINLAPFTGTNTDEQTLTFGGTTLAISNGNFVDLSTLQDGTGSDDQTLTLSSDQLSIENGNSVDLSGYFDNTDAQTLSLSGDNIIISGGNSLDVSSLKDGYEANTDEQTLSLATTNLSISGGNTVDMSSFKELPLQTSNDGKYLTTDGTDPSWAAISFNNLTDVPVNLDTDDSDDFDGAYGSLSGAPTNVSTFINDAGYLDAVEVIQGRNVSGSAPANGQVLKWNNSTSAWEPSDDALGVAGTSDGVVSTAAVTGTSTKTITLSRTESLGNVTATFTDMVDDADADATNEIQDLSLSTNILSLTDDASTVDLSGYLDNTDDQTLAEILTANTSAGNKKITSLATPTSDYDAATKKYIDDAVSGAGSAFSTTSNVTSNSNGDLTNDDFLFGSATLDDDGTTNHDKRFFFDKSKGAFRAGYVVDAAWDEANRGTYSAAFGAGCTASGSNSFAAGSSAIASYEGAIAIGRQVVASEYYAFASGNKTVASGAGSFSSGYGTESSGSGAFTMGYNTTASGSYSFANGDSTIANSYALTVLGRYNEVLNSNSTSWVSTDPLFIIGNGTNTSNRHNALTLLKNGKLGLNVNDPDATLEVNGSFHYTDGNENDGWILTSDASGNASWTAPANPTLSISGTDLSISGGNTIDISSVQDGTGTDDQTLDEILTVNTSAGSNKITSLATPTADYDAATKKYVDESVFNAVQTIDKFALNGSTLELSLLYDSEADKTVDLSSLQDGIGTDDQTLDEILSVSTSAGTHKITNVVDPTADQDAATKKYVDDAIPNVEELKTKISNIARADYNDDILSRYGITTSEQYLSGLGGNAMSGVYKTYDNTALEIEVDTYVQFTNMDTGGDVVIKMQLSNGTDADFGPSSIIIYSAQAQSDTYVRIHLKGYWTGLSGSTNYYPQFTVKQTSSGDSDATVKINHTYGVWSVVAKEYMDR